MPESKILQVKENRLPAVFPASKDFSTAVSKKPGILGSLAVFTPLVVEIIYGLTRKWLSEKTGSKAVSETADKREAEEKMVSRIPVTAGCRRYRGRQN